MGGFACASASSATAACDDGGRADEEHTTIYGAWTPTEVDALDGRAT